MIRISKLSDYAIVLLTYFARDPDGEVRNARDLVDESKLPLPTVSKVLKMLSRGELLVSHRGVNGGYNLARSPEKISVAEIIAVIEGPIAMTECSASAPGLCDLEHYCPVQTNWRRINRTVAHALDGLTLAEMARPLHRPILMRGRAAPKLAALPGRIS